MNGKKAKAIRKEARRIAEENRLDAMQVGQKVPLAGCPKCGNRHWLMRLDSPPPNHTTLVSMICSNDECHQEIMIDLNIMEHVPKQPGRVLVDVKMCKGCGFEKDDCQCGEF